MIISASAAAGQNHLLTKRDLWALLIVVALFVILLAGTWQRWTQPIIDHGREMNLPARLLAGEQLYADVQFLYGPFAPYFNALLYRLFGVHLNTLQVSGIVCALLILLLIYWLSRQLLSEDEAALAAALVLVLCAIKATASYISPYAYAALYGQVFALVALVGAVRYLQTQSDRWMLLAGAATGLALASKLDLFLPAAAAGVVAWLLVSLTAGKIRWRATLLFVVPALLLGGGAYAAILSRVSWRVLIEDNYALFFNFPPQLIYYNRNIGGFTNWPRSLLNLLAAAGALLMIGGLCALIGALLARRHQQVKERIPARVWQVMLAGLLLWLMMVVSFGARGEASPFIGAPLVLLAVLLWAARQWWRLHRHNHHEAVPWAILLLIAVFGLTSIVRVLLNVTTSGPYTPFFIPAVIVVYACLLFRLAPAWLLDMDSGAKKFSHEFSRIDANVAERHSKPLDKSEGHNSSSGTFASIRENSWPVFAGESAQAYAQRAALTLIALAVIATAAGSIQRLRKRHTYPIATARGNFLTLPHLGQPVAEAIEYVQQHTSANDAVLVLPEGTSINFLTARRYPLREEIVHPGFLTGTKERDAIGRLAAQQVPLILLANLDTSEFGDRAFGVDYNQALLGWIKANYHLKKVFGKSGARAGLGDDGFFIQAYARN